MNEPKAIQLCLKEHDPRGFEWLVERYRREALMHARGFMGNEADAADACQDAFQRAYLAMPRLAQMDRFYPWFYRILRNHCLNRLRTEKRRNTGRVHLEADEIGLSAQSTPRMDAEAGERQEAVHAALDALQPDFREILLLKYFDKLNYGQIAGLLGIRKGTVMSRLYYARKAFAKVYEP